MKQFFHITILIWPTPMSWNCIPLINHLGVIDFLGSWGSFPQYEPWSNFASGWLIFEGPSLTNRYLKNLLNIDVTTPNHLNLIEISRRDCFRLTEIWSGLSFRSTEFLDILLLDIMIKWSGLSLLNRVLRHSALLIWSIKMVCLFSTKF